MYFEAYGQFKAHSAPLAIYFKQNVRHAQKRFIS